MRGVRTHNTGNLDVKTVFVVTKMGIAVSETFFCGRQTSFFLFWEGGKLETYPQQGHCGSLETPFWVIGDPRKTSTGHLILLVNAHSK